MKIGLYITHPGDRIGPEALAALGTGADPLLLPVRACQASPLRNELDEVTPWAKAAWL